MIAEYEENVYFVSVRNNEATLLTYDQNKSVGGFEPKRDYFKKTVNIDDPKLVSIYDLHFYVRYKDSVEKTELWLVDEGRFVCHNQNVENNEVVIDVPHDAQDESWTQYDKGAALKKINLHDCTEFLVEKKFIKQNGRLVNGIIERKSVTLTEFKNSIIMNRRVNF